MNGVLTYGFLCPNFENQNKQTAVSQLNKLQATIPLLVTSESGHIVYVNQAALDALNICNVSNSDKLDTTTCYTPVVNPTQEAALARTGQLDEDLAIYAISFIEGVLAKSYGGQSAKKQIEFYSKQIVNSLSLYSQLGYTTVQEGAASQDLIKIYLATAAATPLPATMAFLEYDGATAANFQSSVTNAVNLRNAIKSGGYDMFIAGMKAFADGSNQGYTGDMDPSSVTYMNLNQPFTESLIFSQPYDGLADYDTSALNTAIAAAHAASFPLWVHTNGNQAQTNVLTALAGNAAPPLRDVVVHFTMPTQSQVNTAPQSAGVTFLANNFYYYYQPLCEQVLGATATADLYPALWAQQAKLHYSLHSDAGVTPPSPLFSVWVASTRNYQHGNWLPKISAPCLTAVKTTQKISKLQGMRAYANEAAWLYNRDTTNSSQPGIGSLQNGYAGDLVILSADPLAPRADLSTIYVLYTVHNGKVVYPMTGISKGPATNPSIWPK